jgi:hypothetical protein
MELSLDSVSPLSVHPSIQTLLIELTSCVSGSRDDWDYVGFEEVGISILYQLKNQNGISYGRGPTLCEMNYDPQSTLPRPSLLVLHITNTPSCFSIIGRLTLSIQIPQRNPNFRSLQHSRPNSQIRPGRSSCRQQLDLGCHPPTVFWSRIPLWSQWAVLVCQRCYSADLTLRDLGHRAQTTSTQCAYLPRSHQSSIWSGHSCGVPYLRSRD